MSINNTHSWLFVRRIVHFGDTDAAGVIHSDFQRNFIKAEAVSYENFVKYGSAEKCKENGKLRIEGKDYVVKDGDVLYFRVNS